MKELELHQSQVALPQRLLRMLQSDTSKINKTMQPARHHASILVVPRGQTLRIAAFITHLRRVALTDFTVSAGPAPGGLGSDGTRRSAGGTQSRHGNLPQCSCVLIGHVTVHSVNSVTVGAGAAGPRRRERAAPE
eukprot:768421-Hanusia_phi.AAC.1